MMHLSKNLKENTDDRWTLKHWFRHFDNSIFRLCWLFPCNIFVYTFRRRKTWSGAQYSVFIMIKIQQLLALGCTCPSKKYEKTVHGKGS